MFQHLKITDIKALKEATLLNLGKVNVVCGKNNSGKSTLLEGINDPFRRIIGKEFGGADFEALREYFVDTDWWLSLSTNTDREQFLQTLLEAAKTQKIWFSDESDKFAESAHREYFAIDRSNIQKPSLLAKGMLRDAFRLLYTDSLGSTVILPPKRNLESNANLARQNYRPDGWGLINTLFQSKNQNTGTQERALYERIREAFTNISSGYSFDISIPPDDTAIQLALSFAYKDKQWIEAQNCGLGLQDLIIILFFALNKEHEIVLIEEPESHLHPEIQRKLLRFLRQETDKQFFISTHSNVFLNNAFVDRVFFTSFQESVVVDDATSRASILDDLGYEVTDNLVSDLVILVEGPTDIPIIEEFIKKLELDASYNIKTWPIGGDIMSQVDLSVFSQNYTIIAVVDRDPGSKRARDKFEAKCAEYGIHLTRLKRYAIENYFTLRALKEIFHSQIPETIIELNPDKKLEDQIGIDVKHNNRRLARAMTIDEIKGTDLYDFFTLVGQKCKDSH